MNPRTIRIIERCEFGEPGELLCPEPWDIAFLLVEVRRVAEYVEPPAVIKAQVAQRQSKRRRPGAPLSGAK
jgi:hypothetical protein